jgi:ABC-type lipoprotein export system ATPase subunit
MPESSGQLRLLNIGRQFDPPEGPLVLKDVSFEAVAGEMIAIVGPSGSGKSTLLHIIGSLDRPTSGTVSLGRTIVNGLEGPALAEYRSRQVGFVFQDHHLLPQLTALENVMLPSLAGRRDGDISGKAQELLDCVGLGNRRSAFPSRLSGGERQRVAVARAMINGPALLLCDEPTGNLDRDNGQRIVQLLREMARRRQVIVLMVTHNLELAGECDRILELRDGYLRPSGESA